jgi:hypothetical protein
VIAEQLLSRLQGVKRTGAGWEALCPVPVHDDRNASLSIAEGKGGRILLKCHAGCPVESVVGELGLRLADLFPPGTDPKNKVKGRIVAIYDYTDETGALRFQCVRFEPKNFKQRRPDPSKPGGWVWNLNGARRVLYRLPDVRTALTAGRAIFIAEGEKDCDALATHGFAATCNPMGAGKWLPEHTETLRGAARVVVIADKDTPGRNHAQAVATALHPVAKSVKLIELPDVNGKPVKDAGDYFAAGGTADELRAIVKAAPEFAPASEPQSSNAGSVASEYFGGNDTKGGETVDFPEPEPWRGSVDGAALLDDIRIVQRRYVVASDAAFTVSALFALHTYAFDLGDISPILFITGPTKRCGKSRLLSVLARLVNRPLTASSASAAGIYRTIELHRPTLLIDEVDSFLKGDEHLRGLVNSGHTRDAAFHLGCVRVGSDFEPRRWSTWTPKILSGIGKLAETIEDRAFIVQMRRRLRNEAAERLRHGTRFDELRSKCAKFVADHSGAIRAANPAIPDALNDRASDNWTPLLVLADLAGGEWPNKARQAALELSGNDDTEALGINAQLLADIRHVFDEQNNTDRLASKALCERLAEIEGRPWAEFGKGQKQISPNQLANLLREFGIASRGVRIGDATPKGYLRDDFADAFSRYLPGNGESKRHNATTPASIGENPLSQTATPEACCVSENTTLTNNDAGCCGVAFPKAETSSEKVYV